MTVRTERTMNTAKSCIRSEFWPIFAQLGDCEVGVSAYLEVETDESDTSRVAIHTFVDGRGSVTSYYLSRDEAVQFARDLLDAVETRTS